MATYYPPRQLPSQPKRTEFDVLKSSHRLLRDEDEREGDLSWDDRVAKKYYDNLYREFAVCDLKHYKSGNFSLRWRSEDELLSGIGETTCGNTRCQHHHPSGSDGVKFQTLELPFAYAEGGEMKSALVKVALCRRCVKKLMWKRNKEKEGLEKEKAEREGLSRTEGRAAKVEDSAVPVKREDDLDDQTPMVLAGESGSGEESGTRVKVEEEDGRQRGNDRRDKRRSRHRDSRSRSPERRDSTRRHERDRRRPRSDSQSR